MPSFLKTLLWALSGAFFLYLFTQIRYEWVIGDTQVPLTGQSLAVLIIGFCWPGWSGVLAVLFYLLAGGLGLPVFAEGASGWEVFGAGSGGYLLGFLAAAWYLRTARHRAAGIAGILLQLFIASILLLGFGFIRLVQLYGVPSALEYGVYALWPGALIKWLIAAGVAWAWRKWS